MSDSNAPAYCVNGHTDSVRLLSMFASAGVAAASAPASTSRPSAGCGGGCACAG